MLRWLYIFAFILLSMGPAAASNANGKIAPYGLARALSAPQTSQLYAHKGMSGFDLSSSYYSGYASGLTPSGDLADFVTDQKLYAILIDGRYDFSYEMPFLSEPLRPYLSAGAGVAALGTNANAMGRSLDFESASATPLLRFGGGVAYRLGEQWNLSLDYKAGHAPLAVGDQTYTGRGQEAVNLQSLNLGMNLSF